MEAKSTCDQELNDMRAAYVRARAGSFARRFAQHIGYVLEVVDFFGDDDLAIFDALCKQSKIDREQETWA